MSTADTVKWIIGIGAFWFVFVLIARRAQQSKNSAIRWLFGGVIFKRKGLAENQYPGLRSKALSMESDALGLKDDLPRDHVFGAIMELGFNDHVVTLIAFETGDSSMYVSSGGIFIGGFTKPSIRAAAGDFVIRSRSFLPKAERTDFIDRVPAEHVAFYLLTPAGRYRLLQAMPKQGDLGSVDASLFNSAQILIARWRESAS